MVVMSIAICKHVTRVIVSIFYLPWKTQISVVVVILFLEKKFNVTQLKSVVLISLEIIHNSHTSSSS